MRLLFLLLILAILSPSIVPVIATSGSKPLFDDFQIDITLENSLPGAWGKIYYVDTSENWVNESLMFVPVKAYTVHAYPDVSHHIIIDLGHPLCVTGNLSVTGKISVAGVTSKPFPLLEVYLPPSNIRNIELYIAQRPPLEHYWNETL